MIFIVEEFLHVEKSIITIEECKSIIKKEKEYESKFITNFLLHELNSYYYSLTQYLQIVHY